MWEGCGVKLINPCWMDLILIQPAPEVIGQEVGRDPGQGYKHHHGYSGKYSHFAQDDAVLKPVTSSTWRLARSRLGGEWFRSNLQQLSNGLVPCSVPLKCDFRFCHTLKRCFKRGTCVSGGGKKVRYQRTAASGNLSGT